MKQHSTCSKAVFAHISRVPDRSVYFSVGPRRRRWRSRKCRPGTVPAEVLCLQVKGKHVRKQLALLSIGTLSAWMYGRLD
jgi:hypothetical protein